MEVLTTLFEQCLPTKAASVGIQGHLLLLSFSKARPPFLE
jgi:hypothetical protein